MIGNYDWHSKMADEIYGILESYEQSPDIYEIGAISAVSDFFENYVDAQWSLGCTDWPDMTGGVCYVSWIEAGQLKMEAFDYIR